MIATLTVTPETHWLNGWFLRLFARPYVLVDGVEVLAHWGGPCVIPVEPGRHVVAVGARYLRTRPLLGVDSAHVSVEPGQEMRLRARNGALNHQPFAVRTLA
ncbi:hypothetical protein [Mycetocola zhadangensis]|nr:hypothetical protein [Mycetocola zhadangensis]